MQRHYFRELNPPSDQPLKINDFEYSSRISSLGHPPDYEHKNPAASLIQLHKNSLPASDWVTLPEEAYHQSAPMRRFKEHKEEAEYVYHDPTDNRQFTISTEEIEQQQSSVSIFAEESKFSNKDDVLRLWKFDETDGDGHPTLTMPANMNLSPFATIISPIHIIYDAQLIASLRFLQSRHFCLN